MTEYNRTTKNDPRVDLTDAACPLEILVGSPPLAFYIATPLSLCWLHQQDTLSRANAKQNFTSTFFIVFHLRSNKNPVLLWLFLHWIQKPNALIRKKLGDFHLWWYTHDDNWNKTMVLLVEITFLELKPKTQCIGRGKLGCVHPWHGLVN